MCPCLNRSCEHCHAAGANSSAVNDSPMIFSGKPSELMMSRASPLCFVPLTVNKKTAADNGSNTGEVQH